ncbi:MAG TPA: hypothetical protein VIM31_00100 [Candidatus Microsaccharimonas sp.]
MSPTEQIRLRQIAMRAQEIQLKEVEKETTISTFETTVEILAQKIVSTRFLGCQVYTFENQEYAGVPIYGTNSDSEPIGNLLHILVNGQSQYVVVEDARSTYDVPSYIPFTFAPAGTVDLHGSRFNPRAEGAYDSSTYGHYGIFANNAAIQKRLDWYEYHKDRDV